jgi:hypothetical protein
MKASLELQIGNYLRKADCRDQSMKMITSTVSDWEKPGHQPMDKDPKDLTMVSQLRTTWRK